MLRILLYAALFYLLYKLVKNLLRTSRKKTHLEGNSGRSKPRPYDKNNVEDIDYEEL